ncbi:MAG: DNA mismatch repair endonuclease MutL [bacterium]
MSEGGHIRLLPTDVANKIAAGEVVERPASILKEILENSIDAGSTQIDVDVVSGGTRLVSVADNGSGMNRDDALLSIERHATSKIYTAADIEHIHTLGFRGEALAAISSVSRFRLQTRRHEDLAGTELVVTGGKLLDVKDAGCPPGSTIEVRDLFFNIPVRRKFLRSPQTETVHVRQMFMLQALAWPAVGMSLTIDGRRSWSLAAGASPKERIRELFGKEILVKLCPVEKTGGEVKLSGYVSLPELTRGDRTEQYVFVNGRPATAPVVSYAINEAYHALIAEGRHPYVFLYLELEPELVDVNVHPTKKEVRFRNPSEVRDALISTIRSALSAAGSAFVAGQATAPDTAVSREEQVVLPSLTIDDLPPSRVFSYPRLPPVEPRPPQLLPGNGAGAGPGPAPVVAGLPAPKGPWTWCRVIGQIGGLYVLLETEDGYVVMDPHAAHERVLFEEILHSLEHGNVESQGLLSPVTVALQPRDAMYVRKNLELIKKMGAGVSEFGGDTFVVDALPQGMDGLNIQELLIDMARHLETLGERGSHTRWREEAIAQAACKAAVKARDHLSLREVEELVVALASAEMPYTCPHGRPTLIYTSLKELARKFGRE